MRPFEQAWLVEFVRRADGPPEAVSGVGTVTLVSVGDLGGFVG